MSGTGTAPVSRAPVIYRFGGGDGSSPFPFDTWSGDHDDSDAPDGSSALSLTALPTLAYHWQAAYLRDAGHPTLGVAVAGGNRSSSEEGGSSEFSAVPLAGGGHSGGTASSSGGPPSSELSAVTSADAEGSGGGVTVSSSGSGLVFINTYGSGCTAAFEACIVAAEKQLESLFTNSITLNITFEETNEGNNNDAASNSWAGFVTVSYATLKAKLQSIDPDLPSSDPSGGAGFSLPEAYARMLGLSSTTPTVDDTVTLNSYYDWSYGQDIINAVTHEVTEGAMGRVGGLGDQNSVWSTMDLFRYTASGTPDYTDGRDGLTTYFASNGSDISSRAVPELSFNNEYDSSGAKVNGGDTADWTQQAVFGSTGAGEALTLDQTELDVMEALGWDPTISQDVFNVTSGHWETATNWSAGSMPITVEDALISGILSPATATLDSNVTVNSISTGPLGLLTISGDKILTATNGTVLNPADKTAFLSGNFGTIDVDVGSTLEIGDTFDNVGTLTIGAILNSSGGNGSLNLDGGTVTLDSSASGAATVNLGQVSNSFQAESTGSITNGSLINVDDTIVGGGSINLAGFDNQIGGVIDANQEEGKSLEISASTFTNEGTMTANTRATLDLGADGATESLANTGSVDIDGDGDLAISGNFTISGTGDISMKGAGAEITSDGETADTLTNESSIYDDLTSGQIGDVGVFGAANDLTFDNSGAAGVSGAGDTLTLATGSNVIGDGGGTLEAESDGHLVIDSNVETGVMRPTPMSFPTAGTIEAASGGVVTDAAAISDGVSSPFLSVAGQVVISGGIFELLASGSVSIPIEFTGAAGILELHGTSAPAGGISGLAAGDSFELAGSSISAYSIGASSITIATSAAAYDFASVGYSGVVTGFVGWADASTGLERVTFADGAAIALSLSSSSIYLANAPASVTGGGDTVVFVGGAAESVDLSSTAGEWDAVNGANATVTLTSAQASVFGGGDTIDFAGSGDAASLYGTTPSWDAVIGSSGTVYLNSAEANISGGSDTISFASGSDAASLYNTGGDWDAVVGSGGTVYLNNAQANVSGGSDTISFASGSDATSLYDTNGDWDAVVGSGGTVYLDSAQANVSGGSDTMTFASGADAVALYDTIGDWDAVVGSNGAVYLNNAQTNVFGGLNTINFAGGADAVALYGTSGDWDAVVGSGGTVYVNDAQANVSGGLDSVFFGSGPDDAVGIYDTGGDWDAVTGSSGLVYLTSSQANISGSLDTIDFSGAGNEISIYSTAGLWDTVDGSNGTVFLTSAQASISGDGDKISISGTGSIASLGSTGVAGDLVDGSSATVDLYGVTAKLTGSTDTVNFNESDTLNLIGSSEVLAFQAGIGGNDVIKGFASSDVIQMSHSDFLDFAALQSSGDLQPLGSSDTLITLGAADSITLLGVKPSTLTSLQFNFV